jgi:homocysteine S-methyltransferase
MGVTLTQTRSAEFREALENRVLGTMLYSKGVFINRCCDELNLSLPALVSAVAVRS